LFPNLSDWSSKISDGFAGPFIAGSFQKHGKYRQHNRHKNGPKEKLYTESIFIIRSILMAGEKKVNNLEKVVICLYFIAKNNKPLSDIPKLLIRIKKCNAGILSGFSYQ
jgi:hypothetical protein